MGCNNSGGCQCGECSDITLLTPADGLDATGFAGGFSAFYTFSTATSSTPATGIANFDNANVSAATILYVNITDRNGAGMTTFLSEMGTSTNTTKANLRVFADEDYRNFCDYNVTAYTLVGSVARLSITPVAQSTNSPFANTDKIVITYSQTGNKGTNGTDGTDGTVVLYNDNTPSPTGSGDTGGLWVTQSGKTFTVTAGELANDGDAINISFVASNFDVNYATDGETNQARFHFDNNSVTFDIDHTFTSHLEYLKVDVLISRITSTTGQALITKITGTGFQSTWVGHYPLTGIDWTLTTLVSMLANTTIDKVDTFNFIVTKLSV